MSGRIIHGDATEEAWRGERKLPGKLHLHDLFADEALDYIIDWLQRDREALLALARGRHVLGHYKFADSLMYEYDENRLKAEAAEEVADCINYIARRLHLLSGDSYNSFT